MTAILYVYKKCSTCQDALRFLKERNIIFLEKEITLTPPSIDELRCMQEYLGGDSKKLFNTSGILYRELGLSEKLKGMTNEQTLMLLSQNGMLVKRPFLLGATFGLVGFREPQWLSTNF